MSTFKPGFYTKGDVRRQAHTASQAVALVADGFSLETTDTTEASAPAPTVSDTAPVLDDPTSLFLDDEEDDESQEDE